MAKNTSLKKLIFKSPYSYLLLFFIVTGLVVLSATTFSHDLPAIERQISLSTKQQPQRLTELYFTHPNNLPDTYHQGQRQYVAFTVHNLEFATTKYNYQIVEASKDSSKNQVLANGSFYLKQNQYKNSIIAVSPANVGKRVSISIRLTNTNESISYLADQK